MAPASSVTVHVRIDGRVQGVGYRAWVERTADQLGLYGWVRNRNDGSVEAVFSGPQTVVDDMVGRCEIGPRSAAVSKVEVSASTGTFAGFEVRATE